MGQANLHDGKQVMIMSPEQWTTYCYNYNQLNGLPQPPQLVADMQAIQQENIRR
jgi:hypothetical protein